MLSGKNKLLRNSILYTIGAIIPQAVGFLLLPVMTRYLTPEEYGITSSMGTLSVILIIFLTLAIERSIYRLYYDYKTTEEKRNFLGTISISLFIISTFIVLTLFILHDYVGLVFRSIPVFPYYSYAILTTYFSVFGMVPLIYYMVTEQAKKFFLLSLGLFLLHASLTVWFVVGFRWGAAGQLGAHLVANLSFVPLYAFLLKRIVNFKLDLQMLKRGLSFSLPLIPTLLSAWILSLSDRIFIERYFTLHDVGIYSLGYQIALVVTVIVGGIHKAYTPFFFRLANSEDQKNSREKLYNTNTVYILVVILTVFLISFFSKEIVTLMMHHRYLEAYKIIPLITFGYLFSLTAGIPGLYIQQEKRTKAFMYLTLCSAGINILLNFLLVPQYGAYGAAYATVISFAILLIAKYLYAAKRCYFIPWDWSKIMPYFLALFATVALFSTVINLNIYVGLVVKILIALPVLFIFSKQYHIINLKKVVYEIRGSEH